MKQCRRVTLTLLFGTFVCLVFLGVRCLYLGRIERVGVFCSIILAWIPYGLSLAAAVLMASPRSNKPVLATVLVLWLLFLPNAAYIVTDLTHWRKEKLLPVWYDWIFISALAWVGLFLAFLSIQVLHRIVAQKCGEAAGWMFVAFSLGASSFGIYAGRFFRWNSWDALLNVRRIFGGLYALTHPPTAGHALAFCGMYFVFSAMIYLLLHAISMERRQVPWQPRR